MVNVSLGKKKVKNKYNADVAEHIWGINGQHLFVVQLKGEICLAIYGLKDSGTSR